ncbi:pyridoxal phosphate-dependent transferase [Paraphoma chrysanthemicola]|nr:pyridoxal phosphate-dependent transferase [Paraphoma chrysanthemicola]
MRAPLSTRGVHTHSAGLGDKIVWGKCSDVWDETKNPEGYVPLGLAENTLMHKELRGFLNSKSLIDASARALTYGDGPFGSKSLRHALTGFFNDYFHPVQPVQVDHLMITNGVTSAVEHCAWNLADPGEGILLGRPYYRAFINAMQLRAGVQVVPVTFGGIDPCGLNCVEEYERALLESNSRGVRIRALLLSHPHNPLGRFYTRQTIVRLMELCQKHSIHLIIDEIYALSTWENTADSSEVKPADFVSVLSINTQGVIDPSLVHVLWGASKDFGANGLRLGVMVSQANPDLVSACRACAYFSSPSSLAENALRAVISDHTFLEEYLSVNRSRISIAYEYAIRLLQDGGIEHMPGTTAAFFVWLNLGKKYVERHPERARDKDGMEIANIVQEVINNKKVFLVGGEAMGAEEPGWFRMVFTQSPVDVAEGVKRIVEALS